jgi:diguanylate cyclase (GGDEF)-like protein
MGEPKPQNERRGSAEFRTPWYKKPDKSLRVYRNLAQIDSLTQVGSRSELYSELEKKGIKNTTVLFMDIDKFKDVNDSYGDKYGDEVLKILGARLLNKFTNVYRKGGEEFVVVLSNVSVHDAEKRAEAFRRETEEGVILLSDGRKLSKTISIGIADGNNYKSSEDLVNAAGVAMHDAKNNGRNQIVVAQSS